MTELHRLTLAELNEGLRSRHFSSVELARHFLNMREAIATEASAKILNIGIPGRVPRADAAWQAMAEFHGISVATLRQRAKRLSQIISEPVKHPRQEDPATRKGLAPKKTRLPDRRRRNGRKLL